jgi:hypothetical protein
MKETMTQPLSPPISLPLGDNTPITTTGAKLRDGIIAEFAQFGQQIDTLEAETIKPHTFALKQAEYALAQIAMSDDELLAVFGNTITAAQVREMLTAEHAPKKAAAEAEIARLHEHYDAQHNKLTLVGEDIAAGSTDELMALVTVDGVITPGSIRAGFASWVQTQIQQERDAIITAQAIHTTNIGVFAALGDRLALMSNDDIVDAIDAQIVEP